MSRPVPMIVEFAEGTTESEAAIIRSQLRLFPQVRDVRPMTTHATGTAGWRRDEIASDVTPIFEKLRAETLGALDAATDSFRAVVEPHRSVPRAGA